MTSVTLAEITARYGKRKPVKTAALKYVKRWWKHEPSGRIVECYTTPWLSDWDRSNWVCLSP